MVTKILEPVSSTSRRTARASYLDEYPRDFDPRAKFQIPVGPRPGREGEKCRPLDHMRQIPFINPLCSHAT